MVGRIIHARHRVICYSGSVSARIYLSCCEGARVSLIAARTYILTARCNCGEGKCNYPRSVLKKEKDKKKREKEKYIKIEVGIFYSGDTTPKIV